MNAHPIDIEALRREAQQSEDRRLYTMRVKPQAMLDFLDLLAAAEHRATRAEAQSAIRGRAVVIYRDRAREAEAEVKRLSWKCGHLADKYDTDTEELRQEADRAEARIKAVQDVLSADEHVTRQMGTLGQWQPGTPAIAHDTIRRALDGDA